MISLWGFCISNLGIHLNLHHELDHSVSQKRKTLSLYASYLSFSGEVIWLHADFHLKTSSENNIISGYRVNVNMQNTLNFVLLLSLTRNDFENGL